MDIKYCPKCGRKVEKYMGFCPKCGENLIKWKRMKPPPKTNPPIQTNIKPPIQTSFQTLKPPKNTKVSILLSFLIPGTGQIYARKIKRGIIFLIGSPLIAIITAWIFGLGGLIIPSIIWLWQIYDAYSLTKKYNEYFLQTGTPPW